MKSLIVTGANGGIGIATIKELIPLGFRLICVDIKVEQLEKLQREVPSQIVIIKNDLSTLMDCENVVNTAGKNIAGLVHLAGVLENDLEINKDPLLWNRVIQANLRNAYDLSGYVLGGLNPAMKISIVFVSSLSYRRGSFDSVAYSVAKAGLAGLTRSIAKRVGNKGTVNAIAPGIIMTEMSREYLSQHKDRLITQIPQKRFGEPEEVAKLIKFLISDECTYITGQVINIDGGSWNS